MQRKGKIVLGAVILLIAFALGCKTIHNSYSHLHEVKNDSELNLEPITKTGLYFDLKQHTFFTGAKFHSFNISEDEATIVFSAKIDNEYFHLYNQDPYHKTFSQITAGNFNNIFPHLSSDKKKVAFVSDRDGYTNIYIVDLDKTFIVAQVTDDKSEKLLPIFSPDNSKILYTSKENGKYILVIIDLNTKIRTFLGEGIGFGWTQNNKALFIKPHSGKINTLWTIDVDKLSVSQVMYDPKKYIAFPTINAKGNMVTYSKISTNKDGNILNIIFPSVASEIWLATIDDSKRAEYQIINDEYTNFNPQIGGGRIYFVSDRRDGENIWSMKASLESSP